MDKMMEENHDRDEEKAKAETQANQTGQALVTEITPLYEAAVAIREMFLTLVEGGFTENQALKFCAYHLAAMGKSDD